MTVPLLDRKPDDDDVMTFTSSQRLNGDPRKDDEYLFASKTTNPAQ